MKRLFDRSPSRKPILAPLAAGDTWHRAVASRLANLPPAAIPVAVTLGGGIALIVALGLLLGSGETDLASRPAPVEEAARLPEAEPAAAPDEADADDVAALIGGDRAGASVLQPSDGTRASGEGLDAVRLFEPFSAPSPGNELTAAIPPALPGGSGMNPPASVPVAETEEQLLALEEAQRAEVEADVGPPSDEWTAAIAGTPGTALQPATTTNYVNLRAGPDDDAEVLMVVPALARIEAEAGCNWCAVSYDGRSGYIYKTFISYE